MARREPVKRNRSGEIPGGKSSPGRGTGRAMAAGRKDPTWKAFESAVAGVLAVLKDGQFVTLSRKRTNYFVQFASRGRAGLRAEAVSNTYLKGKARLGKAQVAALERLGWNQATRTGGETKGGGSPNFFRDCARRVKPAVPSRLAIATLRTVFGVRRPSELEYWASTLQGGEIILPTLGIAQDRRARKRDVRLPKDALADANLSAGRATAAWLTGEGLGSATEKLRVREGEDPIPAPLLDQWRQMLLKATTRAVQSADAVLACFNGEHGLTPVEPPALVDRGAAHVAEAERACRALARLALGVTSHTEWCEETARLERAAVLALSRAGVTVEEEGIVFLGRERSELVSEAAGLLCWMLTQQGCSQEIGNPRAGRPTLKVTVDEKSNLLIRAKDECAAWDAPVTVIEPARYIAEFLSENGGVPLDA